MHLARISIMIGAITKTSRTNVNIGNPIFTFDEELDTFDALQAQVNNIVAPALQAIKTIRDDTTLYLKASLDAKQAEWVALTSSNWKHYIDVARGHYNKRKKVTGPFTIDQFVFAERETQAVRIRRVASSRITEAVHAIEGYLLEHTDVQVGPIARTYWETSHASQPDGTEPYLPAYAFSRPCKPTHRVTTVLRSIINKHDLIGVTVPLGHLTQEAFNLLRYSLTGATLQHFPRGA
ncbi:hypothetical protein PHMEG_0006751 [Phytophthora megakarya]|uniref:Uncharacterized protein n=1 Tax=Phytophthora megakarya TaxID=4795 RepID=A0A225WN53_9STRA|nr:hypothetical protein PHMEG_0006751 [Phytophthora megakarya]